MEKEQVREWAEAQKIAVSIDLVEAAKKHLKFLAAVLQNRFLYEDHVLQRAIYRYNAFWLPLLVKHLENPVSEEPLVVPLDCELIWHCHRLNPLQYKFDCEKLYGRVLGNYKVISSLQATSKSATKEIWNKMYPEEPYELDLQRPFSADVLQNGSQNEKFTSYDLVDAVKRQISFTYQASRPHMSDEVFLREAVARYKGFLHLIRTNRKMNLKHSSVPTYDIDLMWHTHQLYPVFYCKDMKELAGIVIQHNDSHPDKSKGSELDNGFHETTKQWEQTFGSRYWKAGALYRGNIPTPVTQAPYKFNVVGNEFNSLEKYGSQIQFPTLKAVEVLLEFVDIKNLPEERKENLFIGFSKNQPDKVFNTKRWLGISSVSKDKMFALFQCEPKGEFLFELVSYSQPKSNTSMKRLGSCSMSFEELLAPGSQLSTNKWVSVDLVSDLGNSEPVLLHVAMSFSPPMPAPQVFELIRSKPSENDQNQAHVIDCSGKKVLSLQKRNIVKDETKGASDLLTEVYCILDSGEKHKLVESQGNYWSVKGTHGSFMLQNISGKDNSLFELVGYNNLVKVFPGRRLEFEPRQFEDKNTEQDFLSAVEFSTDYPYGRAVALINTKSGTIKATDESIVLPGIALAFMMSDNLKGEDIVKNERLGKCMRLCINSGDNVDMVKAADCNACGPCVDVARNINKVKVADCNACGPCDDVTRNINQVKAADYAYGPCAPCNNVAQNVDLVKAADCACGPCNVVVQNLDLVNAADCACGPCNNVTQILDLVKAADCACGPCNNMAQNLDLVKAADCACGPCNNVAQILDLVKAADCACGPCNNVAQNLDLVKAADCACGPCNNVAQKIGDNVDLVKGANCFFFCLAEHNQAADCSVTFCTAVTNQAMNHGYEIPV